MIYALFGQRDVNRQLYKDFDNVKLWLETLGEITAFVLGGGKGFDALAQRWADENSIPYTVSRPPTTAESAERAFSIRDNAMIREADACCVFWDGVFPHTPKLISKIVIARKTLVVFPL